MREPAALSDAPIASHPARATAGTNTRLQVPFGLTPADGRMYAPREVPLGIACGCVCPGCHAPLIAKHIPKGGKVPHFAHAPGSQCATGFETAVHLAAKQLIAREARIHLPLALARGHVRDTYGLHPTYHHRDQVLVPAGLCALTAVRLERWCETFRPDILATPDSLEPIAIEIAVTSFVGEAKLARLREQARPAVEYDLRHLRDFTWEALYQALIEGQAPARWVYFPALDALSEALSQALREELVRRRGREQIPLFDQEVQRSALVESSERRRKATAQERSAAFRARPWAEKARLVCLGFGVAELPPVLRRSATQEMCFALDEDPAVWQAVLFGAMVHRAAARNEPCFTLEAAVSCAFSCFDVVPPLQDGAELAVAAYLLELVQAGALLREARGRYRVRVASLQTFETLEAYRVCQVRLGNGLDWASASEWPTLQEGRVLAVTHAASSGLGAEAFQALTSSFADAPVTNVLARLAAPPNQAAVLEFWIATGYVCRRIGQ